MSSFVRNYQIRDCNNCINKNLNNRSKVKINQICAKCLSRPDTLQERVLGEIDFYEKRLEEVISYIDKNFNGDIIFITEIDSLAIWGIRNKENLPYEKEILKYLIIYKPKLEDLLSGNPLDFTRNYEFTTIQGIKVNIEIISIQEALKEIQFNTWKGIQILGSINRPDKSVNKFLKDNSSLKLLTLPYCNNYINPENLIRDISQKIKKPKSFSDLELITQVIIYKSLIDKNKLINIEEGMDNMDIVFLKEINEAYIKDNEGIAYAIRLLEIEIAAIKEKSKNFKYKNKDFSKFFTYLIKLEYDLIKTQNPLETLKEFIYLWNINN